MSMSLNKQAIAGIFMIRNPTHKTKSTFEMPEYTVHPGDIMVKFAAPLKPVMRKEKYDGCKV